MKLNSKPFTLYIDSPCHNCVVLAACKEWCRKLDVYFRDMGVEQIEIKECRKNHRFEHPSGDMFHDYHVNCPVCNDIFTGICAGRWIYNVKD